MYELLVSKDIHLFESYTHRKKPFTLHLSHIPNKSACVWFLGGQKKQNMYRFDFNPIAALPLTYYANNKYSNFYN